MNQTPLKKNSQPFFSPRSPSKILSTRGKFQPSFISLHLFIVLLFLIHGEMKQRKSQVFHSNLGFESHFEH